MRKECLEFINKLIKTETPMGEEASIMSEDDLLKNCSLDSLGYAIFWLEVSDKYNLEEEYTNGIDYDHYSIKELIDVCTSNIPRSTRS
jgi:hypothetical protein